VSPRQQADPKRYGSAWAAIVQLVRDGRSWSGGEKNKLLLNRGGAGFADVSSVAGLDSKADGRALAVVDWDQDGDLDLWYRDRTAPRLRLMLNRHATPEGAPDFVALRLEGTTCNRDAIGAVVEVVVEGGAGRLVKSVRAGDLFLSQSSRWLHFGLADAATIRAIEVLWPGGAKETFSGAQAGGSFLLVQGTGTAGKIERRPRRIPAPQVGITGAPPSSRNARVFLPARIPLPPIGFRDAAGQPQMIGPGQPHLILFWSASCAHCGHELATLTTAAARLRGAGLQVSALSVDRGADVSQAYNLIDAVKWPFPWGIVEPDALDRLNEFQRALFDITVPLTTPLGLLCDRSGNVLAIYRGSLGADELIADLASHAGADASDLHTLAPPFAGRWFTKPVDPAFAVEFMARQFETRLPEDALYYLAAAVQRSTGGRRTTLARELAAKHHSFALGYKKRRIPERAAAHFEQSLAALPTGEASLNYGTMLASYGKLHDAQVLLEQALQLEPNLEPARKALAMVKELLAEGR
jgi:hypothetical protein